MQARTIWITVVLVGVVALIAAGGGVIAQEPSEVLAPAATVPSKLTYEGELSDSGGTPLDGTYNMQFRIYDSAAGSTYFWDSGTLSVDVDQGSFNVELQPHHAIFNGQELWLGIKVESDWLSPRQELLPVPYALSLRPGAEMQGNSQTGWGLNVNWTNNLATGGAVRGESASSTGVLGRSAGGYGLAGYSDDSYGVYGSDSGSAQARGYGGYFTSQNGVGVYGHSSATKHHTNLYTPGVYGHSDNGVGVYGRSSSSDSWPSAGVQGWGKSGPGGEFYSYNGNIIEGYEDVNLADDVNLRLRFKVDYYGFVYADGTYTSPAADFAELLPARDGLEPGDVLVIGPDGQLTRSTQAYQSTVVGAHSTKPGFLGGVPEDAGGNEVQVQQAAQPVAHEKEARVELAANGKVPLAIAGIVPVKASAENGPISPGDLLVTSATPGHCMWAGDDPAVGTIVGKALESLDQGTGVIQVLVMLQ
ncbi:hypothetical protein ACFLWA_02490 [Chloroflexota bacterium]